MIMRHPHLRRSQKISPSMWIQSHRFWREAAPNQVFLAAQYAPRHSVTLVRAPYFLMQKYPLHNQNHNWQRTYTHQSYPNQDPSKKPKFNMYKLVKPIRKRSIKYPNDLHLESDFQFFLTFWTAFYHLGHSRTRRRQQQSLVPVLLLEFLLAYVCLRLSNEEFEA